MLIVVGVAVFLLFAALVVTIRRSRRKRSAPTAEHRFFDRGPDEVTNLIPTPPPFAEGEEPAANGGQREPVTVSAGATLDLTSPPSSSTAASSEPLANRRAPSPSRAVSTDAPRAVRFWSLFDPDAEMDETSGPVCFAVDGVTADGVLHLVQMDLENRGFVVRQERPDRLRDHQGPVVLHATVRSVHTGLTHHHGRYQGTPEPFVVVEIEVPTTHPPLPTSPMVRFS